MNKTISFVDLFAGCGGLSYGFHHHPLFKQILATDIWLPAKETYLDNLPESNFALADLSNEKDLESIVSQIGEGIDLLMGGPPCKGFSTLNNSKTHSKFNTLVDQYFTIVDRTKPNVFLMENVRGFKSKKHPSGSTYPEHVFKRILNFTPTYNFTEFILNTNDYGIAQNRMRYFLIGTKVTFDPKKRHLSAIEKLIKSQTSDTKPVLRDVIGDLPRVSVREGAEVLTLSDGSKLFNHKSMNHSVKLEERFKQVPAGGGLMDVPINMLTNHLKKIVTGGYGSGGFSKNIYGRMDWDKPSGTIVAGMDKITVGRFVHPDENRLLTPRECARIQSFPDEFKFSGGMVSQYYQIGNAVPPKLSEIFSNILAEVFYN